jgi:drug/metabolite transporter (DMT)-like permease
VETLGASASSSPLRGVLLLASAVLLFACMDVSTKFLAAHYAIPLIMAVRYIVNLVLMVAVLAPRQGRALFRTQRTGLVIVRGLCLVVASLFLGLALQRMPVAETTAIIFLAPMLVVLVARPLLGETIGFWGWAAVLLGFAGVLLIVRPGSGLDPIGIACLAVTVLVSVAYIVLSRLLSTTETSSAMLFYTALAGSICFGAALPWSIGGPVPSLVEVLLFLGLGITGGLGHFLFTAAFRHAPASLLAPVNYLQLVWAGLLGWLVFGHLPDLPTVLGMAVVTVAGVIVALRSAHRQP